MVDIGNYSDLNFYSYPDIDGVIDILRMRWY